MPTTGKLAWAFTSQFPYNTTSVPDVGSDGIDYQIPNTLQLFADSLSAYLITFTATGNNDTIESLLYALDTDASTTLPVLRSTNIAAKAKIGIDLEVPLL